MLNSTPPAKRSRSVLRELNVLRLAQDDAILLVLNHGPDS